MYEKEVAELNDINLRELEKFLLENYSTQVNDLHDMSPTRAAIKLLTIANTPVFKYQLIDHAGQTRRPEVMADLIEALMKEMGVPMTQGDCANSPIRISKGFLELTDAYGNPPPVVKCFNKECEEGQLMIIKKIFFSSLCEHHMLPFIGYVDVGYIVGEKVIGLSKPSRLVRYFSHQLMIQERFEDQIAKEIMKQTSAHAVFVRVQAEHLCSKIRGAQSIEQDAVNYVEYYKNSSSKKKYLKKFDTFVIEVSKGGDK
jgi:GTP cyclohydrolase I